MLPNYLHIGQGKAGSTALHFLLLQNPSFCLVRAKETHFFDSSDHDKGLAFYERYFDHHRGEPIVGDLTPSHCSLHAQERLARALPHAKISICLRHPVARAWSAYYHDLRTLDRRGPFRAELRTRPERVENGLGGRMLKRLFELFPREQIEVLIYERDVVTIQRAYRKVCDFLGVPAVPVDFSKTQGRGFRPRITFPWAPGRIKDHQGSHFYWPGCAVIETMQETAFYRADVVKWAAYKYAGFMDDVTLALAPAEIAEIHDEFFAEDTALLKTLLNDPLPEWDAIPELKAPPLVQSRIQPTFVRRLLHARAAGS
jgi:hypothetical protein